MWPIGIAARIDLPFPFATCQDYLWQDSPAVTALQMQIACRACFMALKVTVSRRVPLLRGPPQPRRGTHKQVQRFLAQLQHAKRLGGVKCANSHRRLPGLCSHRTLTAQSPLRAQKPYWWNYRFRLSAQLTEEKKCGDFTLPGRIRGLEERS